MSLSKQTMPSSALGNDPALQRSFRGHKDTITSVQFSPNLKQVASGSLDTTLLIWNFKAQQRPFKFVGHKGAIHDIAFSPNGSLLASASKDETVRLWNNSVEGHSATIKAHTAGVRSVNFSCDGKLLLTSSDDKTIKIWNVSDRKILSVFSGHNNWVRSAQFSPDVRLISSGSDDKTVKIWDIDQKQEIHTFFDHTGLINAVKFNPDGTCIASASHDKKIKIWDIRSKRLVQHYDAHSDSVNQISFHPTGYYLISASDDAKLKVWDLRQGKLAYTLYGHEGKATACHFSPGGDYFCTGGGDNVVMVWKSNFNETACEYVEDLQDIRPLSASYKRERSSSGFQVKESKAAPSIKTQIRNDFKEMTFSPSKLKNETFKKSDDFQFSVKDKSFVTSTTITAKDQNIKTNIPLETHTNGNLQQIYAEPNNVIQSTPNYNLNQLPEALSSSIDRIVNQLDIITKTLQVLEMRIGVNEEQVKYLCSLVNTSTGANLNVHTQQYPSANLDDSRIKMQQSIKVIENGYTSGTLPQNTGTFTQNYYQITTNSQNFPTSGSNNLQ